MCEVVVFSVFQHCHYKQNKNRENILKSSHVFVHLRKQLLEYFLCIRYKMAGMCTSEQEKFCTKLAELTVCKGVQTSQKLKCSVTGAIIEA